MHRWQQVNLHCSSSLNTPPLSKSSSHKGHSDHSPDRLIMKMSLVSRVLETQEVESPARHTSRSHPFILFSFTFLFVAATCIQIWDVLTGLCTVRSSGRDVTLRVLRAALLVLVLMASFHWSALDTEKERWCMPSLLPPNTDPPVWRDVLLLE